MSRKVFFLLLLSCGSAQGATVSFSLEGSWIQAQMTITGDTIFADQASYQITDFSTNTVSMSVDYGQGFVDFDVIQGVGPTPDLQSIINLNQTPDGYQANFGGIQVFMTEMTTNPGITTTWQFLNYMDSVPGNEFDDVVRMGSENGESYSHYYPTDGHFYWAQQSSVVPIPAAVWMFSSALAALGWLRRKQAT